MWEHPANTNGGSWYIVVPIGDKDSADTMTLDSYWLNTLLGLIGGTLDPSNIICGVSVRGECSRGNGAWH